MPVTFTSSSSRIVAIVDSTDLSLFCLFLLDRVFAGEEGEEGFHDECG